MDHKRSLDVEGAEARLDEAIACLTRQVAVLEAAAEDFKDATYVPAFAAPATGTQECLKKTSQIYWDGFWPSVCGMHRLHI